MIVPCPGCGKPMRIDEGKLPPNKKVRATCKSCGHRFVVRRAQDPDGAGPGEQTEAPERERKLESEIKLGKPQPYSPKKQCPKCGHTNVAPPGSLYPPTECEMCGIVFDRYSLKNGPGDHAGKETVRFPVYTSDEPQPKKGISTGALSVVVALAILGLLFFFNWGKKPSTESAYLSGGGDSVRIYTTQACYWCKKAKEYLDKEGVAYREFDVGRDPVAAKELYRITGRRAVPVTICKDRVVIGYDEGGLKSIKKCYAESRSG